MAGLLDSLNPFKSAPTAPQQVPLDPNAQKILGDATQRANAPASSFGDSANQGASEYASGLGGTTNNFGGGQDSNLEAIKSAYRSQATKQIQDLKQRNDWQGEAQKGQYSQQIAAAAMGQQKALVQQYQTLTDIANQQEAARAQFVNQLFQTANYGIGVRAASKKGAGGPAWASTNSPGAQNGVSDNFGGQGAPDFSNLA